MATFTDIIGLQNSWVDGEPVSDTWFENVANHLEWARYGYVGIEVAGTGDYPADPDTEAPCKVLVLSGILTGNRNLLLPVDAGQEWLIENGTTGAFTLTAKTAAGTGVTITQGYRARVFADGVNLQRGSLDHDGSGNVIIAGGAISGITDLAVADGGTGASTAANARTNLGVPPTTRLISAGTGLASGGDLSADRTLALSAQAQKDLGRAPGVTAAAEVANARTLTIQLKEFAADLTSEARLVRVWLGDAALGAECATAPDGGVTFGSGTVLQTITAGKQWWVMSTAAGVITLTLTESAAKTFYVMAAMDSRVTSAAVAFA
jgi:hypothetical protein